MANTAYSSKKAIRTEGREVSLQKERGRERGRERERERERKRWREKEREREKRLLRKRYRDCLYIGAVPSFQGPRLFCSSPGSKNKDLLNLSGSGQSGLP